MDRSLSALLVATGVLTAAAVMHLSDEAPWLIPTRQPGEETQKWEAVVPHWPREWKATPRQERRDLTLPTLEARPAHPAE